MPSLTSSSNPLTVQLLNISLAPIASIGKLGSPFSPLGPGSPFSPFSPLSPLFPSGPGSPFSPLGPGSPGSPFSPGGPWITERSVISEAIWVWTLAALLSNCCCRLITSEIVC